MSKKLCRKIVVLLCMMSVVFCIAGCGKKEEKTSSNVTLPEGLIDDSAVLVELEGAKKSSITMGDFKKLNLVSQHMSRTNSKGEVKEGDYIGASWKDFKDAAGISEYTTITMIADDGYTVDYTKEQLDAEGSLFAIVENGEPINEKDAASHLNYCAGKDVTANFWCKNIIKIVVK